MPAAIHAPLRIVQSRQNARVRQLRAALARPSARLIGLEGVHLVEEALRSGLAVQTIFVRLGAESLLDALLAGLRRTLPSGGHGHRLDSHEHRLDSIELLAVPGDVLESAVSTDTPQPIAALAVPPEFTLADVFPGPVNTPGASTPIEAEKLAPLLLVLAGLQDPGNLGAILRSAEAFGATGILALAGTAGVWNAKTLRASMGSAFRLPVLAVTEQQALATLHTHGVRSLAAVAPAHPGARALIELDLRAPVALWIGNEGAGLTPQQIAHCDLAVTIPCPGPVESLNAAVAAGVLLYEASRQRAGLAHPTSP